MVSTLPAAHTHCSLIKTHLSRGHLFPAVPLRRGTHLPFNWPCVCERVDVLRVGVSTKAEPAAAFPPASRASRPASLIPVIWQG